MKIFNIKGNTYYFETKYAYMPFYKVNENEIIMLDSGYPEADEKIINDLIAEYNFTVKAVICSHAHIDHIGNNNWLKKNFNTEIIMSEYESMTCNSGYNLKAYNLPPLPKRVVDNFMKMICETDRKISNKEKYVDIDGHKFEIVSLPGHTFYHIGIITPDDILYVGDSILSKDVIEDTKVAFIADITSYIETMEKLRGMSCYKYILAHKGLFEDINEVIDENVRYLDNQMKLIIDLINKPMTMSEIYKEAFKKLEIRKNISSYFLAETMMKSHIYYLIDNSVIKLEIIDGVMMCSLNKHNAVG